MLSIPVKTLLRHHHPEVLMESKISAQPMVTETPVRWKCYGINIDAKVLAKLDVPSQAINQFTPRDSVLSRLTTHT
jgi:hypothetical protein